MLTDDDPDYSYDNCALCSETLEEQMVSNKEFLEFWNYIFLSISFLSVFVGLCAFFILSKTKPTKFLIYIVMNLLLALGDIGVITIVFLQLKQFDISNHQLLMDLSQSNHFVVTTVIIREMLSFFIMFLFLLRVESDGNAIQFWDCYTSKILEKNNTIY